MKTISTQQHNKKRNKAPTFAIINFLSSAFAQKYLLIDSSNYKGFTFHARILANKKNLRDNSFADYQNITSLHRRFFLNFKFKNKDDTKWFIPNGK